MLASMPSPSSRVARRLGTFWKSRRYAVLSPIPFALTVAGACSEGQKTNPAQSPDASLVASAPDDTDLETEERTSTREHSSTLTSSSDRSVGPHSTATSGPADPSIGPERTETRTSAPHTSTATLEDAGATTVAQTTANTPMTSDLPLPGSGPTLRDGQVWVDGAPFQIRGVNWNPVPVGATHPQGLDYAGSVLEDAPLMQAAGINAVRTYEHLDDTLVLDTLYAHGIYVFTTVYGWWQDEPTAVTERVNAVKDHPAILGYVLGNEWNYNQLYSNGEISTTETRDQINAAAALVKQADRNKIVCTIYGELGDLGAMVQSMPDIDMWGINVYRGISFGDLFQVYAEQSPKPMFLGEFGADAYNATIDAYDPTSQAAATTALIDEIKAAYVAGKTAGGFIFEWSDEWWKDSAGSADVQDVGGIAPGGGPYPDATFNEEWWGIVDIDRQPRAAYDAIKAAYAP
jgi:hypothetical protein